MKKTICIFLVCLFFLMANPVFAVTAKIPNFDVYLNGELLNNESATYPLIVYKGITYFPMTWDYTNALGLKTIWDNVNGFSIEKDSKYGDFKESLDGNNKLNSSVNVSIPNFKIVVNGKEINNNKEEYPLLSYKSITYFPMTWRFAHDEFKLATVYDEVNGFFVFRDINVITKGGYTVLLKASALGNTSLVQKFIDAGADVNMKCGTIVSLTPISVAITNCDCKVVITLLNAGAKVEDGVLSLVSSNYEDNPKESLKLFRLLEYRGFTGDYFPMLGMTPVDVRLSRWGRPDKINKTVGSYGVHEQWVYDDYKYLYFENGVLTTIQD